MRKGQSNIKLKHTQDFKKLVLVQKSMQEPNTGCWIWMGYCDKDGYGRTSLDRKLWLAHRLSYTLFVGSIPNGLTIDHICKNPYCINPKHLEAVTMSENNNRGNSPSATNHRKTHCKMGHIFSHMNIRTRSRLCNECIKLRNNKLT